MVVLGPCVTTMVAVGFVNVGCMMFTTPFTEVAVAVTVGMAEP